MMRILNEPPPPIQRPDLPPQVFEVIVKAMAKTPGGRFPSAVAFATRLQHLQMELRLPVTELAGSDSMTGRSRQAAPEVDHSGFTGPGFDMLVRSFEPHLPAAHPDAAAPPAPPRNVPSPPVSRPPAPRPVPQQPTAPPARHSSTGPREMTPRTLPETVDPRPAEPPVDEAGRRGALVAGVLAVLLIGTAAGVGGILLLGGGDGGGHKPTPGPTSAAPSSHSAAPAVPVPASVMRAATPRDLRAFAKGPLVSLRWKLAQGNKNPIMVQQNDEKGAQPPQALPPHTLRTTISGLDPAKGYCFTVGSFVAMGETNGQPATIAWSKPVCIRGASVH
jgi:hypothetical protein